MIRPSPPRSSMLSRGMVKYSDHQGPIEFRAGVPSRIGNFQHVHPYHPAGSPGLQFALQFLQEIRFNILTLLQGEITVSIDTEQVDTSTSTFLEEMGTLCLMISSMDTNANVPSVWRISKTANVTGNLNERNL